MPCNNCLAPDAYGQIRRMKSRRRRPGSGGGRRAQQLGFDWNPANRELYFTDNGRDWLSEELPQDELNRVTRPGRISALLIATRATCPIRNSAGAGPAPEFVPPVAKLGAHAAVLGMRFYTGTMFPAEYRGAIFVARHGSWNKTVKIGGDVVAVKLNRDGTVRTVEPFLTGFIAGNAYLGRPGRLAMMKDGSLLVSDDWNGAIYRITYGGARPAHAR